MRLWAAIYLLVLAMTSCNFERRSMVVNTSVESWHRAAIMKTENVDTMQLFDMSIFMRYDPLLITSDSIPLYITTTTPSESVVVERMTIYPNVDTSDYKRAYGEGRAKIIEVPYRQNIRWRELGWYQISIHPTQPTSGVEAVGVLF